jgi:hypothetical protein
MQCASTAAWPPPTLQPVCQLLACGTTTQPMTYAYQYSRCIKPLFVLCMCQPMSCQCSAEHPSHPSTTTMPRCSSFPTPCVCAGFLLCCPPIQAAPVPQQLVLLDSNAAIVSRLKQMQQTKQKFGTQDPGSALASRFTVSRAAAVLLSS